MSTGDVSYIVCAIYRPGSAAVTAAFFVDLADVLDRLATFVDPLFVVGDLNVHLERTDDATAAQLVDVLADHGLSCRVTASTHDAGGLLDVVASRDDLSPPLVDVIDVGLSDHRLLRWSVPMRRPPTVYTTTVVRPWCQLDATAFRDSLLSSLVCNRMRGTITISRACTTRTKSPQQTVTCRRRPSDPWFDDDCQAIRSSTRAPVTIADVTAAAASWTTERRVPET